MYFYRAFGLNIAADFEIPEFLAGSQRASIDVHIRAGVVPEVIQEGPHQLLIHIPYLAKIWVENGNTITYVSHEAADADRMRLFLLGSAMGALLQQRGAIVLHGNAVSLDHKTSTIFVGKQGAGKSTTAAWSYLQGARILADDVCAVTFDPHGVPHVIPSYPQLKLWKTSAELLHITTQNLRKVCQKEEKFVLPITDQFHREPLPIAHIIEIDTLRAVPQKLHGIEKLQVLKRHSYRYYFLRRAGRVAAYTKILLQLAGRVCVSTQPRMQLMTAAAQKSA